MPPWVLSKAWDVVGLGTSSWIGVGKDHDHTDCLKWGNGSCLQFKTPIFCCFFHSLLKNVMHRALSFMSNNNHSC